MTPERQFGHGRHVPAGARDAIYDKVPANLDVIHAQTSAPIRLFNHEGRELYDRCLDARQPATYATTERVTRAVLIPRAVHAVRRLAHRLRQ